MRHRAERSRSLAGAPRHAARSPSPEARGATYSVVRPTGTESGWQEGLKQLHVEAIALADVVEAEAELHVKLHVKREARAVGKGGWQGGGTGEGYPGPASLELARLRRSRCQHPSAREKLQGLQFRMWKHARASSPPPVLLDRGCATMEARYEATAKPLIWAGVRVGEAAQPGPFTSDELLQQRPRS